MFINSKANSKEERRGIKHTTVMFSTNNKDFHPTEEGSCYSSKNGPPN